jgi:hypothetical protein
MWHISIFSHAHYWERCINGSTPIKKLCQPERSAPMYFSPSFSTGQDQCPLKQDLELPTAHRRDHCRGVGALTSGTLTPRLPLAVLQCMVHRGQVLVNPSSTSIVSHTSLHIFHKLILENLLVYVFLMLGLT